MQGRAQGPRSRSRRSRRGGTLARTFRLGAAASGLLALTAVTVAGAAGLGLEVNRTVEGDVLQRTNATRRARGVPALDRSDALSSLAREHSCAMAREGFFGHRSPTHGDLGERIRRAGTPFARVAENLAYVSASDPADVAVKIWLESPGHRANLLDDRFTETGVGACRAGERYYVTQLFVSHHDSQAAHRPPEADGAPVRTFAVGANRLDPR